ncbi:MAG: FAD-dependent oxidoreductase [Clostridia bacterium]|nr:FAD-dependent oxidoreductase [Clostridia bacterium]
MARRMTLEGAKVKAVCEIMPYSSGLKRNVVQCLNDFDIPLYLSHTITKIHGKDRVSGVTISKVDQNKRPIPNTDLYFDCDTILFSVGLIPENELSIDLGVPLSQKTKGAIVYQDRQTLVEGVFACGNVLHVHDLVDFVLEEASLAGESASNYVKYGAIARNSIDCVNGKNIGYVLPQKIDKNISGDVKVYFRVTNEFRNSKIVCENNGRVIKEKTKKVALPGEMEYMILTEKDLKSVDGEISFSLEERG